jgi:hypothetical protein
VTPLSAPSPEQIFVRAQAVWAARLVPSYEAFTVPCSETLFSDRCARNDTVAFVIRLTDGRTYARDVPDGSDRPDGTVLMHGGYVTGPAGAPLGFYRRTPIPGATAPRIQAVPPNLAADPLETISTVVAVDRAYDVKLRDVEQTDSTSCYHLVLRPLRDPDAYPLRELWVATSSFQIVRLTYGQPFNSSRATVHYDFAPVGPAQIWSIVHIDAEARTDRVSEDLRDITFPSSEPAGYFQP